MCRSAFLKSHWAGLFEQHLGMFVLLLSVSSTGVLCFLGEHVLQVLQDAVLLSCWGVTQRAYSSQKSFGTELGDLYMAM